MKVVKNKMPDKNKIKGEKTSNGIQNTLVILQTPLVSIVS